MNKISNNLDKENLLSILFFSLDFFYNKIFKLAKKIRRIDKYQKRAVF